MVTVETYTTIGVVLFFAIVAYLAYLGWKKTETMSDFAIGLTELNGYWTMLRRCRCDRLIIHFNLFEYRLVQA